MNCLFMFQPVSKNNFAYKNVKEINPLFWQLLITLSKRLKTRISGEISPDISINYTIFVLWVF